MTETEDQIASDHSRVMRGLSATGMRLLEIIQRRKEEARRREAEGQREAAQALRDRQQAQRDAARTIAAQGLDPQWRDGASDRELATAFVYAEAYADSDPLARVAHDQMAQHLDERHESVAEFVDANVRKEDLERVPAPEGAPTTTQQRWIDAARAGEAAERHQTSLETGDGQAPRVLDAEELSRRSDQTIANLIGEDRHTLIIVPEITDGTGRARATVLDPELTQRWLDQNLSSVLGEDPHQVFVVPENFEVVQGDNTKALLATVGEDVANQWADLTQEYGRERADRWLEGNLTASEMGETNKWFLWNEAQREIAEGASIEQAMQELAEREAELGLDLEADDAPREAQEDLASELAEHEGDAAVATERGDMEHAGVGQFPHEKDHSGDLAERDPQAAQVLATTQPGRTQSAAEQVAAAARRNEVNQHKPRKPRQERGPQRDLGR